MKKMFYVLLALLVSLVLVFGVSCDNSNKAPVVVDLGTDAVKVPGWANGTYSVLMDGSTAGELTVESGTFTMKVTKIGIAVASSNITEITKQTNTEVDGKNVYELNANVLDLDYLGKGPASFVFTQVDDNTLTLTGFVTLSFGEFPLDIICEK